MAIRSRSRLRVSACQGAARLSDLHAVLGDLPAAVGASLKDTNLLEALDDGSLDTSRRVGVVGWAGAAALGSAVQLGERANTDLLSQVDVAGNSGYERASAREL